MFPTPVGMNRSIAETAFGRPCVPHARGDEPSFEGVNIVWVEVFPTPVGMNRRLRAMSVISGGVPHARGDEPAGLCCLRAGWLCSPRPWG